ncbi:hypothetical protein ZOSMA_114G00900 [Zostera marina]|uniref:Uncharacterized protein n=1 Tax=Zostera marina TaxID=29655 RepID=A0A0K9Q2J2_ZOSMR|nr:hypothetical protein ZOSMA_114G00900 [Zostera marina]
MVKRIKERYVNQVRRKHDLILREQIDLNKLIRRKISKEECLEFNKLMERAASDGMITLDNDFCDSASLISITGYMLVKGPVLKKKMICDHMRHRLVKFLHPIQML